jgi:hypothetical protein
MAQADGLTGWQADESGFNSSFPDRTGSAGADRAVVKPPDD